MKTIFSMLGEDGVGTLTIQLDEASGNKTMLLGGMGIPVELTLSREVSAQIGQALMFATIPWAEPNRG